MVKRRLEETEDQRKERKKAKKEAKKAKKIAGSSSDSNKEQAGGEKQAPLTTTTTTTARVLSSSSSSCYQRKTVRVLFSLYPSQLENVVHEIQNTMRQMLLRHVSGGIDGILLAFDNIRLVTEGGGRPAVGTIINEQPQIHYEADLDVLVFSPVKGVVLRGVVTECFETHIGLLVHNYFNASIRSDQLTGYVFEDQAWLHQDGSTMIAAEETIEFSVDKVHVCGGAVSLEGVDPIVPY